MNPADLAALHASAFDRPWDADTFESLLAQSGVAALGDPDGFVLIRTVADEAEILTLAVRPDARRQGVGAALVDAAVLLSRARGAARLHLEVAEDNSAALALYRGAGFVETGRRPRYYVRPTGPDAAAVLLSLNLG